MAAADRGLLLRAWTDRDGQPDPVSDAGPPDIRLAPSLPDPDDVVVVDVEVRVNAPCVPEDHLRRVIAAGSGEVVEVPVGTGTKQHECVIARVVVDDPVKRWVFPEPKGGRQVVVQYPFVFTARRD